MDPVKRSSLCTQLGKDQALRYSYPCGSWSFGNISYIMLLKTFVLLKGVGGWSYGQLKLKNAVHDVPVLEVAIAH